jgi:hypothetical protein
MFVHPASPKKQNIGPTFNCPGSICQYNTQWSTATREHRGYEGPSRKHGPSITITRKISTFVRPASPKKQNIGPTFNCPRSIRQYNTQSGPRPQGSIKATRELPENTATYTRVHTWGRLQLLLNLIHPARRQQTPPQNQLC